MVFTDARIFHVNVNCTDLENSRRFYADGLGLEVGARTAVDRAQPGTAFGLEQARWDAWILLGPKGYAGGAIDLLEWKEPTPAGAAPNGINECGYQRLGVRVSDLDRTLAAVSDLEGSLWSAPLGHALPDGGEIRVAFVNDPDGTAIELIEGGGPALSLVAVACARLDASVAFYTGLGFREVARYTSESPDGTHLRIAGPVAMDEIVLAAPGGGDVIFILVGFRNPPAIATASRPANAIGMWRTALLVSDLDRDVETLAAQHIALISDPVAMEMGEGLPELRFVCFRGPDGEVIELIQQP